MITATTRACARLYPYGGRRSTHAGWLPEPLTQLRIVVATKVCCVAQDVHSSRYVQVSAPSSLRTRTCAMS